MGKKCVVKAILTSDMYLFSNFFQRSSLSFQPLGMIFDILNQSCNVNFIHFMIFMPLALFNQMIKIDFKE